MLLVTPPIKPNQFCCFLKMIQCFLLGFHLLF